MKQMFSRKTRYYYLLRCARNFFIHKLKRIRGAHISTYICNSAEVARDFVIGKNGFVGPACTFASGVVMGDYVMVAREVVIYGNDHNFDQIGQPVIFSGRPKPKTTIVGDDVWIGARATIKEGVKIGSGSIIGAGSLVLHDVGECEIVAGVPAKHKRYRFDDEVSRKNHLKKISGKIEENYCEPK